MAYLQALKRNKKTYIALMSIFTMIIAYNEATQFWERVQELSLIGYLMLTSTFIFMLNLAVRLKIWEN